MAYMQLGDVIVPEIYGKYHIERAEQKSALIRSGMVETGPMWHGLAAGSGAKVTLPILKRFNAERQILSDVTPLTVSTMDGSLADVAAIHNDGNAFGQSDLIPLLADLDPLNKILDMTADWELGVDQKIVIATLKGTFACPGLADNVLNIASESIAGRNKETTCLNGSTFIDATQRLGDRGDDLVGVVMNSAVEAFLRKENLIETRPPSEGQPLIKMFQGRVVIVDDSMPVRDGTTDGKVFMTVLFGNGAFVKGSAPLNGMPLLGGVGTEGFEMFRNPLANQSGLIIRRRLILHERGMKWIGTPAGRSPSDFELADGANWERVWAAKNIRLVAVYHNI